MAKETAYKNMQLERDGPPPASFAQKVVLVVFVTLGGALLCGVLGYFALVRMLSYGIYRTGNGDLMISAEAPEGFYVILAAIALLGAIGGFTFVMKSLLKHDE